LIQAKVTGETEARTVISINNRKVVLTEERVNVPGLAAAIVGVAAGETKDTVLVMPEDFEREDLRGKEVAVKIEMTSVSSRTLPELDDNLALAASKFATYAELRADVAARIRERKVADAARQYEDQVLGTFADLSKIVYPPSYLEDRVAEAMEDFKTQVKQSGFNEFEDYLKLQGQTVEQLEEELRPGAERRSRRGLVMRELTKIENITATKAEVETAITTEAQHQVEHHGADLREVTRILRRKENVDSIENQLLSRKVIDRMVNIANGA
jgi:FKBP-type peptidyl-prolyl cis-trans isomerase (trigger factor)